MYFYYLKNFYHRPSNINKYVPDKNNERINNIYLLVILINTGDSINQLFNW